MRRSKSVADMRTPMDLIIKRHPEKKKQIRKYMEKWNKRTTGGQQWPKEGTFDPTCCDEMEAVIKHHKPKDKSDIREGKRIRENESERFRYRQRRWIARKREQDATAQSNPRTVGLQADAPTRERSGVEGRAKKVRRKVSRCTVKTRQLRARKNALPIRNPEKRKNQPQC
ncbi:hypothetical protein SKAU_G00415690 [Synaphobranchus kaupii]|uniref:Uncharacterized protein n=1 Tax=Synaphobranchus kaupii TaxID=118154 RepID=A0A9Q1E7D5_SYNKA|nr:hypothetical protein SKAU_G00415690 [Synaphobranchus kaupii]